MDSGFGSATAPKFGFNWSLVSNMTLRGTWSQSVRIPSLTDLDESRNFVVLTTLIDSRSPTGITEALVWSGKNALLHEERATSRTAGLDLTSQLIRGLSVSMTYFDISFRDRIQGSSFTANVLNDPRYAPMIVRNPTAALVGSICEHSLYYQGTTFTCSNLPVEAIVDLRARNLETLRTNGIDLNAIYERSGSYGKLEYLMNGTYLFHFSEQNGVGSQANELLSTQNNPINLRLRSSLTWQRGPIGATGAINFVNAYRDTASIPERRVAAWATYDLQLKYDIDASGERWLGNTHVTLNASNLFNHKPPFLNNQIVGLGYDQENGNPFGRIVGVQIDKAW
jgi:iron complex outermembrane receptor protein